MPGRGTVFPMSKKALRKNNQFSPQYDFMEFLATRDFAFDVFDFNVKALDTTNQWTVAAGATATTWAVRGEAGGWIRGVSGTTAATSGLQLSIPTAYWTGSAKAAFAIGYRPSVITETRFEMGFVNALPSVNTNIGNNLTTPTFNTTTTAAIYLFDHTGSTTTSGLYTIGSAASAQKAQTTTYRPTAAGYHFVYIEVNGQTVSLYTGDSDAPIATLTSAVTAADALIPVSAHKKSDTTTSNIDIDFIAVASGRLG